MSVIMPVTEMLLHCPWAKPCSIHYVIVCWSDQGQTGGTSLLDFAKVRLLVQVF